MTLETASLEGSDVEHILRPEDSMLQQGSNQVVPYCGLEHADIKGQHLFNKTEEYDDVEEIEDPCSNCTRILRLNREEM